MHNNKAVVERFHSKRIKQGGKLKQEGSPENITFIIASTEMMH